MSLTKIPVLFLFGLGAHIALSPPNPTTTKKKRIMGDGVDIHLATSTVKHAYWVHAAIELAIILAAAVPKSRAAEAILTFPLLRMDPSRIFLSPAGVLATALVMMGGFIRFQCYREMGKYFTFQVTILKDHKLITSGPYSYVRHPAYAGGCFTYAGMLIWYTAQGSWLRESEVYKMPLAWFILAPVIAIISVPFIAIFRRMPKEDEILKETFGKEWEEWAAQVPARIFPGIY